MSGARPPKNPRLGALGARLKQVRLAGGWGQVAFAAQLGDGWDQSRISKIEGGHISCRPEDVTHWAACAGAGAEVGAELALLHQRTTTANLRVAEAAQFPGGLVAQIDEIAALEAASTTVAEYQQVVIPAMGQTADYGRAFLAQPDRPTVAGVADPDAVVARRMARQQRILDGTRRVVIAVNDAALLAHRDAPHEVSRAALEHLASLHPAVELLVEPIGQMAASLGGFELLDDCVLLEGVDGTRIIAEPGAVARFRTALDAIRARSYRGADAVRRIRGRAGLR